MDSPTCPMVQWDSHLCTMDSDGRLGHPWVTGGRVKGGSEVAELCQNRSQTVDSNVHYLGLEMSSWDECGR